MSTPKSQYGYFSSLEQSIKTALSVYITFFFTWMALTGTGVWGSSPGLIGRRFEITLVITSCLGGICWGVFYLAGKVGWVGEVNIWLDRRFFRLLERSNRVIFETLLRTQEPELYRVAAHLKQHEQHQVAQAVFTKLASKDHLFQALLQTGIFRLWVWYWIVLYGTFVFSTLTVGSFFIVALQVALHAKIIFTVAWLISLGHIMVGIALGFRLVRMTKITADVIVKCYGPEIGAMIGEKLNQFAHRLEKREVFHEVY